jgi:hypothetical protein
MRTSRARRRHPLAAANAVLEHLILRHFGLNLRRTETKGSSPRAQERAEGHTAP